MTERPNIRVVVPGGTAEEFERAASRLGRAFFIASDAPFPEQIRIEALFGAGALVVRAEATATPASRLGRAGAVVRLDRLEPGSIEISIATDVTTEPTEALVEVRLASGTKPMRAAMAHVVRRPTPDETEPSDDFEAGMVTKASNVPATLAMDLKDLEEDHETDIPPLTPAEPTDPPRATAAIIRRATPPAGHAAQVPIFKPEEPAPDHLTTETVAFAAPSELLKPVVEEAPAKPDPSSIFKPPPPSVDDAWATAETIAVIVDPSTIAGAVPDAPGPSSAGPAAAVDKSSDAAFQDVSSTTSTIVFSSVGSSTVEDPAAIDSAFVDNPSSTIVIDDPAALDVSTGVFRPADSTLTSTPTTRATPPRTPTRPRPPSMPASSPRSISSDASPSPSFGAQAAMGVGVAALAAPTTPAGTHDLAAAELKDAARLIVEPSFSRRVPIAILVVGVIAAIAVALINSW